MTAAGAAGIALTDTARGTFAATRRAAGTATCDNRKIKFSHLREREREKKTVIVNSYEVHLLFLQVVHWQLVHLQVAPQLQVPATKKKKKRC